MENRQWLPWWAVLLLLMVVSSPAFANWLPEIRLTNAADISYLSQNNARCLIADQTGTVHLVWYDSRKGDSEIYYNRFNGVVWGPETAITHNTTVSEDPAAAVDSDGVLHVVWVDQLGGTPEIYYKAFNGVSWTAATAVTGGSMACENPSIAADGLGRLHLVWRDYQDGWGIFYSMFDGAAWSEDLRISDPAGYLLHASIACDDSHHVHVVWDDYRHANWEIYYRRFDGTTWEPEIRLTSDTGISENPTVIADTNGNAQVFWDDNRTGIFDIYRKTFDGITWSADAKIVDAAGGAFLPSVATGPGGTLHLVWYDTPSGHRDVYYMAFDGMSWGPVERLTEVSAHSANPMIAVDSAGLCHAVWHDSRDGNFEIYWRARGILSKPELTSIEPDSGHAYTPVGVTDLAGANFFADVEVWLQKNGEDSISASNEVIVSASRITCDLDLTAAPLGLWDVVVRNFDLQLDTLTACFRVVPLPPTEVTSIAPDIGRADDMVHIDQISGTGFAVGAAVRLEMAGEDSFEASNVIVESVFSISCDFILTGAEPGAWDVVVENPDSQTGTLPTGFTVLPSRWSGDLRLTHNGAESSLPKPNARAIAVDSQGNIHVVWSDLRDGNREIYYKFFDGMSWSADLRLTVSDNDSENPAMAIDGYDGLHVVWDDYRDNDYEIYYKYHNGTAWSADERVTDAPGDSRHPSIDVDDDDNIHLAWQDRRPGNDQYAYFRIRVGSAWLGEHIVADDVPASGTPAVAVDGNNHAHVVWYQDYGNEEKLLHRKFDGYTWDNTYVITDSYKVYGPTVAIDNLNQVHVAWHDTRYGNHEIFYKRYNGINWGFDNRVTDASGTSANASVVVDDSGHVHLVWRDECGGDAQLYYSRKEGDAWAGPVRLTMSPGESTLPSLALAPDGSLHLVWRELRDGGSEIYYKTRASDELAAIDDRLSDAEPFERLRVSPNPVRGSARIQFSLALRAEPGLSVYDVSGRLVERIEAGLMGPGPQSIAWNGKDAAGKPVAQGIYFVEVSARGHAASTKIIVLR